MRKIFWIPLSFIILVFVAVVFGVVYNEFQARKAAFLAKQNTLAVNWKICDAHLTEVDSGIGSHGPSNIKLHVDWLELHTSTATTAEGKPTAGMSDENLRTCLEMK